MTTPDVPIHFEFEIEVPGSPEQVWAALATSTGISAWFLPTDTDEHLGGRLITHMGPDGDVPADITGWDPPRRFAYEEDWAAMIGRPGADVTPLATEFLVEARSGGTCVVRVVSSAFGTGADWEHEFMDDMTSSWLPFFEQLRLYLRDFVGRPATTFNADAKIVGTPAEVRAAVLHHLGVDGVGDAVAIDGREGIVEQLDPVVLLRLTAPIAGMLRVSPGGPAGAEVIEVVGYLFPDAATDAAALAAREQGAWATWLDELTTEAT